MQERGEQLPAVHDQRRTIRTPRTQLNGCLAMTDCSSFSSCIDTVLAGGSAPGGSSGSGGTTNGAGGSGNGGGAGGALGGTGGGVLSGSGGTGGGGASASGGSGGGAVGGSGAAPSGGSSGSGGQLGTGGGSGGASPAPELMTSGPGAYWMPGQVTKVTRGTAGLVVDQNTKYQRWDGFGGAFNEAGWDALSVLDSDQVTNAMMLLFDQQSGAKFVYGRVPIGASDYALSWYTLDDTAGDYTMSKFSISRDQQKLIPYLKAALQVRSDLRLWASPWIPPSWMEDGSSNMKSDAQTQEAYALYLAKFVQEYGKVGITIAAIHPQNEPGYARVHWAQSLLVDFFKKYLGAHGSRNRT